MCSFAESDDRWAMIYIWYVGVTSARIYFRNYVATVSILVFVCKYIYNNMSRGSKKIKGRGDDGLAGVGICMDE